MATHLPRISRNRFQLGIAVGDMVAIVFLIGIGLLSHGTNPLASISRTLLTTVPYLLGWSVAALLTRLYRQTTLESYSRTVTVCAGTWILAALIGSVIRTSRVFPGDSPPIFVLVMIGMGLLTLVPWRILATYLVTEIAD